MRIATILSIYGKMINQKEEQVEHAHLYWEFHEKGGRIAIRKGEWKYVKYNVLNPEKEVSMLFNLTTDIGETNNLSSDYPELIKEFEIILNQEHKESSIFPFNNRK